jgi:hypothetical protein
MNLFDVRACTLTSALPWPCGVHQHDHQRRLTSCVACRIDDSFVPLSISCCHTRRCLDHPSLVVLHALHRECDRCIVKPPLPSLRPAQRPLASGSHSQPHPPHNASLIRRREVVVGYVCVGWSRAHDRSLVGSKVNHGIPPPSPSSRPDSCAHILVCPHSLPSSVLQAIPRAIALSCVHDRRLFASSAVHGRIANKNCVSARAHAREGVVCVYDSREVGHLTPHSTARCTRCRTRRTAFSLITCCCRHACASMGATTTTTVATPCIQHTHCTPPQQLQHLRDTATHVLSTATDAAGP